MKKFLVFLIVAIALILGGFSVYTAPNTATRIDTYTTLSNGSDYNYSIYDIGSGKVIKITDLAMIVNNSADNFDFVRDERCYNITNNTPYTGTSENYGGNKKDMPFYSTEDVLINSNGKKTNITSYDIDGGRYFEISQLCDIIGINYNYIEEENYYDILNDSDNEKDDIYIVPVSADAAKKIISAKNKKLANVDPDKPMIALTFDDGPKIGSTELIVEALKKVDGRATFFVVGEMVKNHPELVTLAHDAGCQIGNHTYSHLDLKKLTPEQIKSQIYQTSNLVYEATGEYTMVGRPPYGSINDTVRNSISIPWFNWDIDTLDWKYKDSAYIKKYVLEHAKDGSVLLMHDLHKTTAAAMVEAIPELAKKFQLVTIDELVEFKYDGDVTKVPGYVK